MDLGPAPSQGSGERMSDDAEVKDAAPAPLTNADLDDIEHGRVGCRCDRLLAEVIRLNSAVVAWQDVAIAERNREPVGKQLQALWESAKALETLR